jgi:hypothetical protein
MAALRPHIAALEFELAVMEAIKGSVEQKDPNQLLAIGAKSALDWQRTGLGAQHPSYRHVIELLRRAVDSMHARGTITSDRRAVMEGLIEKIRSGGKDVNLQLHRLLSQTQNPKGK